MKSIVFLNYCAALAAAHSAVWSITVDGNKYPARDIRMDNVLQAKRAEWNFDNAYNFQWHAVTDVENEGIACGVNARQPEIKAFARAGANVTVQWSNVIRMHSGPVISYLGPVKSPNQKATEIEFFKIAEAGYDNTRKLWANEILIEQDTADTFQLPSDIKPGLYTLRTDLLALHGNMITYMPSEGTGPQFYTHCFNIEISGNGNAEPKGVKFPGAYKRDDPGVKFNVYSGGQAAWAKYVIPGPPKYAGKYEAPTGDKPTVTPEQLGTFPPAFEAKYQELKKKYDAYAVKSADLVNSSNKETKLKSGLDRAGLQADAKTRSAQNAANAKALEALRVEGVKMGVIKA